MNKVLKHQSNNNRDVIGMVGAYPGAGTTYTAFLLAATLGDELNRKTAYLECNNNRDLDLIQGSFQWSQEEVHSFSLGNITFYEAVPEHRITEILNEKYHSFILDFGSDFKQNKNEFLRCNTKIILGGRSEWNWKRYLHFVESIQGIPGSETWISVFPCITKKELDRRRKALKREIYTIPFETDPTEPSRNTIRLLQMLLD